MNVSAGVSAALRNLERDLIAVLIKIHGVESYINLLRRETAGDLICDAIEARKKTLSKGGAMLNGKVPSRPMCMVVWIVVALKKRYKHVSIYDGETTRYDTKVFSIPSSSFFLMLLPLSTARTKTK